jgi:hypothetical protein
MPKVSDHRCAADPTCLEPSDGQREARDGQKEIWDGQSGSLGWAFSFPLGAPIVLHQGLAAEVKPENSAQRLATAPADPAGLDEVLAERIGHAIDPCAAQSPEN